MIHLNLVQPLTSLFSGGDHTEAGKKIRIGAPAVAALGLAAKWFAAPAGLPGSRFRVLGVSP